MNVLYLNVKKEYFELVKAGDKVEEFRLYNEYWKTRLSKKYDCICYMCGYPTKNDKDKRIYFEYDGYTIKTIKHKEFGDNYVKVFAIKLARRIEEKNNDNY